MPVSHGTDRSTAGPAGQLLERTFVWAGGAVFVAALADGAWHYAVRWGTAAAPEPPGLGRWTAIAANAALITAFAAHHSGFARTGVKQWIAKAVPERLLRALYVWIASLLFMLVFASWQWVAGDVYHVTGWPAVLHALVQLAGVGLIAAATRAIDPLELAGIRQPRSVGAPQTGGPYRLVRHPLYLGWTLIVFGAAHMTANRLTFAVITVAYQVVAIPWEERSLGEAFGEAYERYRRLVRWRLVPYVY